MKDSWFEVQDLHGNILAKANELLFYSVQMDDGMMACFILGRQLAEYIF